MPKKPNPRKASDYERHRAESERLGVLDFFEDLIDKGNNPGFAAMLAQRQPPGSKGTERAFLEGMHGWADNVPQTVAGNDVYAEHETIHHETCDKCGAWRGQLGLEASPELFVDHLVEIFYVHLFHLQKFSLMFFPLLESLSKIDLVKLYF